LFWSPGLSACMYQKSRSRCKIFFQVLGAGNEKKAQSLIEYVKYKGC